MAFSIAVLDDSPEFQQLAEVMFNYLGAQPVLQLLNSVDALPGLYQTPPDLLVLDVMMFGMNGLEVWAELRNNPRTRTLPILMATAAVNSIVDQEAALDRDPYTVVLSKPFTLDELRSSLNMLLPNWQLER